MSTKASGRAWPLDLLRIAASIWVLLHHWMSTEGFGLKLIQHYDPPDVNHFLSIFLVSGKLGVDVFFIISGIVISRSAIGKTWSQFGFARFVRLYPSYFVATLVTILVGWWTVSGFSWSPEVWFSLTGLQWFLGLPTPVDQLGHFSTK